MEDSQIVDLFWNREQSAIEEAGKKYGSYLECIAYQILRCEWDAEECVNDTYMKTWNTIPSIRPERLNAYMGKITRNLSLDRVRHRTALKRGGDVQEVVLDELSECIPDKNTVEKIVEDKEIVRILNEFLYGLKGKECNVFLRRYWYLDQIADISLRYGMSDSKVKSMLFRTRRKLVTYLENEGVQL